MRARKRALVLKPSAFATSLFATSNAAAPIGDLAGIRRGNHARFRPAERRLQRSHLGLVNLRPHAFIALQPHRLAFGRYALYRQQLLVGAGLLSLRGAKVAFPGEIVEHPPRQAPFLGDAFGTFALMDQFVTLEQFRI